jgi:hypothetical protein
LVLIGIHKSHGVQIMKHKVSMLSLPGLALLGSLEVGTSTASAQSVYVESYAEPYPVVEAYPVIVAPRYVVRPVVVPPRLVRERTIVATRPGYVPGPVLAPVPPPYLVADW